MQTKRVEANCSRDVAAPIVHEVLRSSGQPLDPVTRAFMEPRFGHDFSNVRVHTDAHAAETARQLNALAYTLGQDMVFQKGRYAPETSAGKQLLAHELTHTIQQGGPVEPKIQSPEIGDGNGVRQSEPDAELNCGFNAARMGDLHGRGSVQSQITRRQGRAIQRKEGDVDLSSWRTALPVAERKATEGLQVTLSETKTAPTIKNQGLGFKGTLTGEQKKIVDAIKKNRADVDSTMLKLSKYKGPKDEQSRYGYSYAGISPKDPTAVSKAGDSREDQIKKVVWNELKHEGGSSAINAYDSMMLTWGRGFGQHGGQLPEIMTQLFKDQEIVTAFQPYGIYYDGGFEVVNTQTGAIEKGLNALGLIQSDARLLGVFIAIAENDRTSQKVVDAQWTKMESGAGKVPKYAHAWDDKLIALVAHISHWWPATGWLSKVFDGKTSAKDILMAWATKAGKKTRNGAYVVSNADTIDPNFKNWGSGVAWDAISAVSPIPQPYSSAQLDDEKNTQLADKMFIAAKGKPGYYVYPSLPTLTDPNGKAVDASLSGDANYHYLHLVSGMPMADILKTMKGLGDKKKLAEMETGYSYEAQMGKRPLIALQAAQLAITKATKKADVEALTKKKEALVASDEFKALPADQQTIIRKTLGLNEPAASPPTK
ncbi:MAG TPA: DUF4157 domain-containing protein [Candidatus Udaeobacter sp.]|nr:DUF4157 domain-containing protein [Candidatus Udaeobacter sp.]